MDSMNLTMFRNAGGKSHNCDISVSPFISCLRLKIGPLAIGLLIVTVIIKSFYGHVCRSFSHIFKKDGKGSPPVAYLYSSASIGMVVFVSFLVASSNHAAPSTVRFANIVPCGISVEQIPFSYRFNLKTSAGFGLTGFERLFRNSDNGAAITMQNAGASSIARGFDFYWSVSYNEKPCKFGSEWDGVSRHSFVNALLCLAPCIRQQPMPGAINIST